MPPSSNETTSGITVIRIALTQRAPTGSTHATTVSLQDASTEARPSPAASPSTSPVRTAAVRDLRMRTSPVGGNRADTEEGRVCRACAATPTQVRRRFVNVSVSTMWAPTFFSSYCSS